MRGVPARTAAALLALALLAGCAGVRPGPTEPAEPAVRFLVDEGGPWREIPADDESAPLAGTPQPAPRRVEPVREVRVPVAPALPVPTRRATPEPPPLGAPPVKRPADLARERFLDHPTRLTGGTITFYCPRRFASEVRMQGEEITDPRPGRRVAQGAARLVCRELRLDADRIVLRVQEEAGAPVQLTARGDVSFVTDQRGQVQRHDHVRILVITNDAVTPLR